MLSRVILSLAIAICVSANQAVRLGPTLERRSIDAGGGWGLMTTSTCPSGTTLVMDVNLDACCPNGQTQQDDTGAGAHVCCPSGSSCLDALQASPVCADDSWVLWNATNNDLGHGYFCCLQGQIGTQDLACDSGSTKVVSTLSAQKIGVTSATSTVPSVKGSGTSAAGTATTSTKAATTKATTTKSSVGGFLSSAASAASHLASDATPLSPANFNILGLKTVGLCTSIVGMVGLFFAVQV